jgi:hypothetical protein
MNNRGGKREGAGRKTRSTPKSLSIWCGQITDEQRTFITRWLTPDERFGVLMAAANTASSRLFDGIGSAPAIVNQSESDLPA